MTPFLGTVDSYDQHLRRCLIKYDDGDQEHLTASEVEMHALASVTVNLNNNDNECTVLDVNNNNNNDDDDHDMDGCTVPDDAHECNDNNDNNNNERTELNGMHDCDVMDARIAEATAHEAKCELLDEILAEGPDFNDELIRRQLHRQPRQTTSLYFTPESHIIPALILLNLSFAMSASTHTPILPDMSQLTSFEDSLSFSATVGSAAVDARSKSLDIDRATYVDPTGSYKVATSRPGLEGELFGDAACEEINYKINNGCMVAVDKRLIKGEFNVLPVKWVWKLKFGKDNKPSRARARLTPMGCFQIPSLDYDVHGIFSPVAHKSSMLAVCSIATQERLLTTSLDIEKAFLSGSLEHDIYCECPSGFVFNDDGTYNNKYMPFGEHTVYKLLSADYGLKQGAAAFHSRLKTVLEEAGFVACMSDPCVFRKGKIYIVCHVDDLNVAYETHAQLTELKQILTKHFTLRDETSWDYILGMDVERVGERGEIIISHRSYINNVLSKYSHLIKQGAAIPAGVKTKLGKADQPTKVGSFPKHSEYRSILGCIAHCANYTHPEIAYAVSVASQYMSNPGESHFVFLIHILNYLSSNNHVEIKFRRSPNGLVLTGYSDSDYAADIDTRRSRTGFCFFIGNNICGWKSKLQPSVALSTAEAEYMALCDACTYSIWMRALMHDLGYPQTSPTPIYCDNKSAIAISHNHYHTRPYIPHLPKPLEIPCHLRPFLALHLPLYATHVER